MIARYPTLTEVVMRMKIAINSVGSGAGSVGGYGCAGPSGFATFSGDSFRGGWIGAKDHAEASILVLPKNHSNCWPAYCHRLKEVNPGTITTMKKNVANQFEYLFIAHAASLQGFHTVIRPVIAIDGTHLKGKYYAWKAYRKADFKEVMLEMIKDGNKDGLVNLSEKNCSCTIFQVDKLPCRHALAAIRYAKKPFPDFCGDCYKTTSWIEAYSGNIFPVGHPSEWNIPQDVRSKVVHPPPFRAQAGRPKKKRFKSVGEHGNGRPEIARFVKNLVTTDRIVRILTMSRLLTMSICNICKHLQHRSDRVDRTGVGNVERRPQFTEMSIDIETLVVRLRY
ncbi:hypothetical protein Dsin_017400 [Dipteronia sinensis]|uniref:SWIM-type domain-containing protein n=1 Tax=Dipteronia sinensis TaxID=43782 RepID=A0AAE0AEZ4_9ROSI|nr:hypothetical protein Dsin_017400 [Dipteronia sinensis]